MLWHAHFGRYTYAIIAVCWVCIREEKFICGHTVCWNLSCIESVLPHTEQGSEILVVAPLLKTWRCFFYKTVCVFLKTLTKMIPKVKIPRGVHKHVTLDFNLDFLRPKRNMPTSHICDETFSDSLQWFGHILVSTNKAFRVEWSRFRSSE